MATAFYGNEQEGSEKRSGWFVPIDSHEVDEEQDVFLQQAVLRT